MTARERLVRLLVQADPLLLDSLYGTQEPSDIADRIVDEVRAEVLNDAADRIERRAAQLGGVWLRTDQVCDTLRRLGSELPVPTEAAKAGDGRG